MPGLSRRRRRWRTFLESWALPAATLLSVLALWELAVKLFNVPIWLLPAPTDIVEALAARGGGLVIHIWVTLYETLLGFFLAILLGVPLAVAIVYSRVLRNAIYPLILVTQSIPKVAFAPILLVWLGYGDAPKIVVAFLVAFFPVIVDTAAGLQTPAPQLIDLAKQLNASQFQIFVKIRFPSALPHFFAGLKIAITLAVIGAVIGEFIGSDRGLGYLVIQSTAHFTTALAFGAMALLALMAIALFYAVVCTEWFVCPWYDRQK